tara:strand:- start:485 stop:1060 length:576 start_codon:yes stop_codon:yes gene_type:complete
MSFRKHNLGNIANKIQNRAKPKDVFYTPEVLAKKHIEMIVSGAGDIWYDNARGKGAYYDNFPTENKRWSEIDEGRDLFDFNERVDIICTNPPYSLLNKILEKSVSLQPRVISYLIGQQNLTPHRLQFMKNNGYGLVKLHLCKVRGFFGYSAICVWERGKEDVISYETQNYYGEFPLNPELDKYGNLIKEEE